MFGIGLCVSTGNTMDGQLSTVIESAVGNSGYIFTNPDAFQLCAAGKCVTVDCSDVGGKGQLLESCTAFKCILADGGQRIW